MSSSKPHIKSFIVKWLACIFNGFLCNAPFTPRSLGEDGGWMMSVRGQSSESGKAGKRKRNVGEARNPNKSPRIQVNRTKSNSIVVIQERQNGPAQPTNPKQNGTKAIEPRNPRTKRGKSPFAYLA
jgi:hypothetical protein